MADISDLWARLEAWGAEHAPKMLEDLNPGASDDDIAEVERVVGRPLPDTFRASLKTHNGENDGWPSKVFADMGRIFPASRSRATGKCVHRLPNRWALNSMTRSVPNKSTMV